MIATMTWPSSTARRGMCRGLTTSPSRCRPSRNWSRAADLLAGHGIALDASIGRHVSGNNVFIYFKDPARRPTSRSTPTSPKSTPGASADRRGGVFDAWRRAFRRMPYSALPRWPPRRLGGHVGGGRGPDRARCPGHGRSVGGRKLAVVGGRVAAGARAVALDRRRPARGRARRGPGRRGHRVGDVPAPPRTTSAPSTAVERSGAWTS